MNELPTIEKFIYQVLANDSVLNSYVSSRIYSYQLPRNAVFPLIQYSYLAGRDVQGLGVSRTLSRPLYQIKVIGRETLPNILQAIADRIDVIFQTISALNFENLAISARREQPVSYQEPGGESETGFRHLGGFFRFDVSGTTGANSPVVYPSSGGMRILDEIPGGAINGSNATFITANNFKPESVEITLNGLSQRKGAGFDYITTGNNTIIFAVSPDAGDTILIDYEVL